MSTSPDPADDLLSTFEDEDGNVYRWVDGRGYELWKGRTPMPTDGLPPSNRRLVAWWRRFVKRHIVDDAPIHDAAHSTHD